jgi:hypothetical protein
MAFSVRSGSLSRCLHGRAGLARPSRPKQRPCRDAFRGPKPCDSSHLSATRSPNAPALDPSARATSGTDASRRSCGGPVAVPLAGWREAPCGRRRGGRSMRSRPSDQTQMPWQTREQPRGGGSTLVSQAAPPSGSMQSTVPRFVVPGETGIVRPVARRIEARRFVRTVARPRGIARGRVAWRFDRPGVDRRVGARGISSRRHFGGACAGSAACRGEADSEEKDDATRHPSMPPMATSSDIRRGASARGDAFVGPDRSRVGGGDFEGRDYRTRFAGPFGCGIHRSPNAPESSPRLCRNASQAADLQVEAQHLQQLGHPSSGVEQRFRKP